MTRWLLLVVCLFSIGCAACEPKAEPIDPEPDKEFYKPTGKEGALAGVIRYEGEVIEPKEIQMDADNYCKTHSGGVKAETLVVNNGKLAHAIVYVKEGPALNYKYTTPGEPVVLDQKSCRYTPHVLALQTSQPLKVTTSDATTHNVHPLPRINKEWNESQPPAGEPLVKTFTRPEIVPVKCNIHPWMNAYVGVFDHPFFAVSDSNGQFQIKGLPPGHYQIAVWHEKLGTQSHPVTIAEGQSTTLEISSKTFQQQ